MQTELPPPPLLLGVEAVETPLPTPVPLRTDLFVTTALGSSDEQIVRAQNYGRELNAPVVARRHFGLPKLFAAQPHAERAFVVQQERVTLFHRNGAQIFYHPNIAYLRLSNLVRGQRDLLLDALQLRPGERVLDATLGYAAEAILCAHAIGEIGVVDGIESVPELGVLVRDGLQTVVTNGAQINEAMRRVRVVHLGHHLDYLRRCATGEYDVVCFDPFFPHAVDGSQPIGPLRAFGDLSSLTREAVDEARRVARRVVSIKAARNQDNLDDYGLVRRVTSWGKVIYGVLPGSGDVSDADGSLAAVA